MGSAYTQTFEPRLYYLYIPQQDQSQIPLFDTATATYNYAQLFNENRFSGFDRINSANDITIGGTTRFINDTTGAELMNLSLGYRYFITPENDFLYGNQTQDAQLFLPSPNLITELNNNWSKTISTTASFQYDTTYSVIDAYTANIKWNPDDGKVINLGFNYQYDLPLLFYAYTPGQAFTPTSYENQYAITVSEQWPIYENKIYAISSANYDFTRQMLLNVVGGAQYNGGCYTISAVYQQYIFNYNQTQSTWMLNFNFKGIGDIGSGDPTTALGMNVPGYMPMNQIQSNQTQ
jgi:LPS-assembly protein